MTTYHLAERDISGRLTTYCTVHTDTMARRMLTALQAAGHTDVQIVPVGRHRTFAEAYGQEVAA